MHVKEQDCSSRSRQVREIYWLLYVSVRIGERMPGGKYVITAVGIVCTPYTRTLLAGHRGEWRGWFLFTRPPGNALSPSDPGKA